MHTHARPSSPARFHHFTRSLFVRTSTSDLSRSLIHSMKPTDSFACHPHRRCLYPTIARPYSNDDSIWLDFNSTGHCPREHIFGKPPFVRPLLLQQQAWTAPNTCPFPASSLWQVSADGLFLPIFSLCNFQQEQFSFRPLSSVSGEILQPDVWKWVDSVSSVQKLLEIQITKNVDFQIWEGKEKESFLKQQRAY